MVLCQILKRYVSGRFFLKTKYFSSSAKTTKSFELCNKRWINLAAIRFGDRRYTNKHEWVEILNGNTGIVGISNYAQEALGDVVFAQLPEIGLELSQKDECGALESVKAASELYSPVSGVVTEKNTEVENTPGLINSSCYDKGWLFKVKISKPEEISKLLSESEYERFLKESESN